MEYFRLKLQQVFRLKNSVFVRNVATLGGGTLLAQAIMVLTMPFLTRIYTPVEFGLFTVFISFFSALSNGSSGKYEVCVILPKGDNVAIEMVGVTVWFAFVVSSIFFLVTFIFQGQLITWLNATSLEGWLLLAPSVLFLVSSFKLFGFLANRHEQYGLMSRSKIVQALVVVSLSLLLGWIGLGFLGLLTGYVAGLVVALVYIIYNLRRFLINFHIGWSTRKSVLARRYIDYPLFNASSGVLDGLTLTLPVFFLTHNFPGEVVGYYAIVLRVMSAPLGFVSAAVSQIHLKKVVDLVNTGNRVEPYLYKITQGLLLWVLSPVIVLAIWGPELFVLVFGEAWVTAGQYVQILVFSMAFKFISSTLSSTLGATNNNRLGAFWKVTAFITTLAVLLVCSINASVVTTLIALTVNDIILYSLYYYIVVISAKNPRRLG